MKCPICKKQMKVDDSFSSIMCEPNWRERKGIRFYCNQHPYQTELIVEVNNPFIKTFLEINEYNLINKMLLLFLDYSVTENSVLSKRFKR